MSKLDSDFINCSQRHELVYRASLYQNKDDVLKYLTNWCKTKGSKNYKHDEVKEILKKAGFKTK